MAKILKILKLPKDEANLRQISTIIEPKELTSNKFKVLIDNMIRTMIAKDGVGLAAPQIGQFIRMAVINTKEGPVCLINPEIIKRSITSVVDEEGCLSIPGYYAKVSRHKSVTCKFTNHAGLESRIEATGLLARAIQHELDHLDGILFIDKMEKKSDDKN